MRLVPAAMRDFARLDALLRERSPDAADDLLERLSRALKLLARTPGMGKPISRPEGHREVYVPRGASTWVIRSRLSDGPRDDTRTERTTVVVVRAWHARELWG